MKKNFGLPYQGSKNGIADFIYKNLPSGKRLVDLFGGGGAISHYAIENNNTLIKKYETFLYNDFDKNVVEYFKKAISSDYEKKWISREEFFKLKDTDPIVKYCWSFSNSGKNYLFSKEKEPWKKALFYARVYNDNSLFKKFDIETDGSRIDIKNNQEEYKNKYIKWYLENVLKVENVNIEDIKNKKEELKQYLKEALKKSGLTREEINKRLGNQMANHYFGDSQWTFPTRKNYNKMKEFLPLEDFDKIYKNCDINLSFESLERLQSLESLESLERLQRLQSLHNLDNLNIDNISYLDYEYEDGDVVYCDPPYENTVGYCINDKNIEEEIEYYSDKAKRKYKKTIKESFNSKQFYDWVASRDYQIFFSSYEINDKRFKIIDKIEKINLMSSNEKKNFEYIYTNK